MKRTKSWEEQQFAKLRAEERNWGAFEFISSIFRYLDSQVGPEYPPYESQMETLREVNPHLADYLDQKAQNIVNDYVNNGRPRKAAAQIQRYLQGLIEQGSEFIEGFSDAYVPNKYSGLPVALAYEMGFLPNAVSTLGVLVEREEPYHLYSNEFKTLLDYGVDLCREVGIDTYLGTLISSVDYTGESNERENIYTKDDLLRMLIRNDDCPKTYKAVQRYLDQVSRKVSQLASNPNVDEAALKLASNIRDAFEEYIREKKLSPGILSQAERKVKGLFKKDNPALEQLRYDVEGRNGPTGLRRGQDVTWDQLFKIAHTSGVIPYVFRFELIRDIGKKLDELEKKTRDATSTRKLGEIAVQIGANFSPASAPLGGSQIKQGLLKNIATFRSDLYDLPWEPLVGLGNRLGFIKIPSNRLAFRDILLR